MHRKVITRHFHTALVLGASLFAAATAGAEALVYSALSAYQIAKSSAAWGEVAWIAKVEGNSTPSTFTPVIWKFTVFDSVSGVDSRRVDERIYDVFVTGDTVTERTFSTDSVRTKVVQFSQKEFINLNDWRVDSNEAVQIVSQTAAFQNIYISSIHFVLQQDPIRNEPIWSLTLRGNDGEVLGRVQLSAQTGEIIQIL